jgi:DNA end-binding protein Ku
MPSTSWKGTISFGLVSFPVQLFAAARAETIHFHLLHKKDLSRVKQVWYCAEEDRPVERSEMVKGYDAGESGFVVVEDQELKQVAPPTASTMEIAQFVGSTEVDPIFFESSYYVASDGKTPKPYSLFVEALRQSKQSAIAQLAMHSREHIVLIRPFEKGLILHTLYYGDELHEDNRADVQRADFSSKELALAQSLIKHLTAPFEPEESPRISTGTP